MITPKFGFIVFGVHKDGLQDPLGQPFIDEGIIARSKEALRNEGIELVEYPVVIATKEEAQKALRTIDLASIRSNGYSFQIETTYRALLRGLRVKEVPIVFVDRRAGESKMNRRIFAEAVMMVWKLRLAALRGEI